MRGQAQIRLWHDDVRPLPSGYTHHATNNEQAKKILITGLVTEISMDHDLGADPVQGIYARGSAEENGMQLVKWMCKTYQEGSRQVLPKKIRVHSWSPAGDTMIDYFQSFIEKVIGEEMGGEFLLLREHFNEARGY